MKSRISRFSLVALAIIFVGFGIQSCTKADINFGSQWVDNNYTKTNMLDTFTPVITTIYQDSFPSNGTGSGLIGVYTDPAFGVVHASTYVRLQPPAITQAIVDSLAGAVYDSAVVFLKLRHNDYGDTTQTVRLNVHQLNRQINYLDNTTNLYNTTSFPVNAQPIGTGTFTLNPNNPPNGDTAVIRLNDAVGQDLFNKMRSFNPYFQDPTDFLTYFNGIKISASAPNNNGFVFNVQDSISIRIYYNINGVGQRLRQYTDFKMNSSAYQFNSISIDRTGTPLGNAGISSTTRSIPSTATGNLAFLQQITGTAIKVTFPSVEDIKNAPSYLRLVKANLIVQPQFNSFLPYFSVPPALYLSPTANYSNTYAEQNGIPAAAILDPVSRQYSYTFDITNYINGTELTTVDLFGRGLIMYVPGATYKTRMGRLIIGDGTLQQKNGGAKLQLYYISVQ